MAQASLSDHYFVSYWLHNVRQEERFSNEALAHKRLHQLKAQSAQMERESLEPIRLLTERWKPDYRRSLKELIRIIGD